MLSEVGSSKGRPYAAEASLLHLRRMPYVLGILGGAALPSLQFEITDNVELQCVRENWILDEEAERNHPHPSPFRAAFISPGR